MFIFRRDCGKTFGIAVIVIAIAIAATLCCRREDEFTLLPFFSFYIQNSRKSIPSNKSVVLFFFLFSFSNECGSIWRCFRKHHNINSINHQNKLVVIFHLSTAIYINWDSRVVDNIPVFSLMSLIRSILSYIPGARHLNDIPRI